MTDPQQPGPLVLPLSPPSADAARAVREKLRGHSTAANWLPEGLWPELDELRSEQLRVRDQVAVELAALDAVNGRFREEDRQHERQLRQAHRDSRPGSVKDARTPREQRQAESAAIEERLWAGVMVLGEVVQESPPREHRARRRASASLPARSRPRASASLGRPLIWPS